MRIRMLVVGLVAFGVSSLRAQQAQVPVDLTVTTPGLSAADSAVVVDAIRAGLQTDMRLHIAYRPPLGASAAEYINREFEVTRFHIAIECRPQLVHTRVTDALEHTVDEGRMLVRPDRPLASAARDAAASIARRIAQ